MQMEDENQGEFFSFMLKQTMDSYLLTLGEFNTDYETSIHQFLFIFGTMFLTLTMLNLVIALMSDAYEEVMSGITE